MHLESKQTRSIYRLPTAMTTQSVDGLATLVMFPWGDFPDAEGFLEKTKNVLDASKEEGATRLFSKTSVSTTDDYIAEVFQWLFNQSKSWNKNEYQFGLDVFLMQIQNSVISFGSTLDGAISISDKDGQQTVWEKTTFAGSEKAYLPTQCFGLAKLPKYQSGQIICSQHIEKIEIVLGVNHAKKNKAYWQGYLTTSST